MLTANKNNRTFCQCISAQFRLNTTKKLEVKNKESFKLTKKVKISKISPSISLKLSKKVLEKCKFYKKRVKQAKVSKVLKKCSYTQASKSTINNIIKIKENFLNFLAKKIEEVYKVFNKPKKDKI